MSDISCREAGRRGGTATSRRYGPEYYKRIGTLGGQRTKEKWGAMFRAWGKMGGRPRRDNWEDTAGTGH